MKKIIPQVLSFLYVLTFAVVMLAPLEAQAGLTIETFAGNGTQGNSGDGGPATEAGISFGFPINILEDGLGNIYFNSASTNLRKVNTEGLIMTMTVTAAGLEISSITADSSGNVYIIAINGWSWVTSILKVDTDGNIITVTSCAYGYSGDGGPVSAAKVAFPMGIAVDSSGNIYIADTYNNRIRKVDTEGIITTVAQFYRPNDVEVDSTGNIYITGFDNYYISKVDTEGIITTVAGNGTAGFSGDGGPATEAAIMVSDIAIGSGNIYIAEGSNNRIRKVDTSGIITTVAGNGTAGFSGDGGVSTEAQFNDPAGVAVDSSGNIYIADSSNYRIRRVYDVPTIITLSSFTATPKAGKVILNWSTASEIDTAGFNLYRSDAEDGAYTKINDALIPAQGSSTQGASYKFTDTAVQNRKTYWYKLEDVDLQGVSTQHGAVSATPRLIFGTVK